MPEPMDLLTLEFLRWIASRRRTYAEAMEAWRSTCPRHTVWEDALIDGLIQIERGGVLRQSVVILTAQGKAALEGNAAQDGSAVFPSPGLE
jgi:hypothetical protein